MRRLLALALAALLLGGCARNYTGRPAGAAAGAGAAADTLELRLSERRLEVGRAASPEQMGDLLRRVTDAVHLGAEIYLQPGTYVLEPVAFTDSSCGNCEDPDTSVPATYGLRISGERVRLAGDHPDSVTIVTNAGYGVLFEDCVGCELSGVTITGGARDPDARATNAAVVVKQSDVQLRDCVLRDNIGDSTVVRESVVGIAGIVGREGAYVDVEDCRILGNSWDGIALYRGARGRIHDNIIDGGDRAAGRTVGGGRGVGIGLTWDARADVVGNLVTRYWKGIGIFVDAQATVRENVVEDVLAWGIAFWSAGRGAPVARIEYNAIHGTGACGAMIAAQPPEPPARRERLDSAAAEAAAGAAGGDDADAIPPAGAQPLGSPLAPARGTFIGNALVNAAQNERYDSGEPYCSQRPLALEQVPPGFIVAGNLVHASRDPAADDAADLQPVDRPLFLEAVQPLIQRLRYWDATRASAFVREFGAPPRTP